MSSCAGAESGRELRSEPMHQWGANSEVVLSDARILDVLIQNSDRWDTDKHTCAAWRSSDGQEAPLSARQIFGS